MAKKKFAKGIDALLGFQDEQATKHKTSIQSRKTITRTTFRLDSDLIETIKAIAYWNRQTTTDVINNALQQFIETMDQELVQEAIEKYKESEASAKLKTSRLPEQPRSKSNQKDNPGF